MAMAITDKWLAQAGIEPETRIYPMSESARTEYLRKFGSREPRPVVSVPKPSEPVEEAKPATIEDRVAALEKKLEEAGLIRS